jgi:hypothetical protein
MSKITWADKVTLDTQPDIARINKVTNEDMNEIKNAHNDLNGTILWTNSNPSVAMSSTDITVQDMSDYDMLEIFYYDYTGTQTMCSARAKVGELINLMTIFQAGNGGYLGNRVVTYINSTTLRFNDPVSIIINDVIHRQAVVDWCIPVYIVGYKTGNFNV